MTLQVHVAEILGEPSIAVITVVGEVNSETAPVLDAHLSEQLAGRNYAVLDLSQTVYISSAGWRGLVDWCIKVRPGGVVVAGMQPAVEDAYDLLGLSYVLRSHTAVADAVEALRARPAVASVSPNRDPRQRNVT